MTFKSYILLTLLIGLFSTGCGTVGGFMREAGDTLDPKPPPATPEEKAVEMRFQELTARLDKIDPDNPNVSIAEVRKDLDDLKELIALADKDESERKARVGQLAAQGAKSIFTGVPFDWSLFLGSLLGAGGTVGVGMAAKSKRKKLMAKMKAMLAAEENAAKVAAATGG